MGDGEGLDDDGPEPTSAGRGAEPYVAVTLAALLFLGGLMGSANLLVDGMVHDGVRRWVYGGTMALLGAAAVLLAVRRRAARLPAFALVLLGDLIYVVVALCITDPVRYATPLMLLFPSFVAAWFLGRWGLAVTMVVTPLAVLVAMWSSYPDPSGLAIQVLVNAGMLDIAALGVFLLRRRVERLLEATQQLTATDPLTGLHNRRYLVDQAPRVWRQARRDGMRIAAMVLDLDHFKQLNDRYGHAAGDAVLRAVATALTGCVRPADVLARTGGEELVVVGMVGDAAEAGRLAERLRAAVAGTRTGDGLAVTASIGVALTRPFDGEDARNALWRLVDRADAAMYAAKQQGRDRVSALLVPHPAPVRAPVRHPLDDATTDVA